MCWYANANVYRGCNARVQYEFITFSYQRA